MFGAEKLFSSYSFDLAINDRDFFVVFLILFFFLYWCKSNWKERRYGGGRRRDGRAIIVEGRIAVTLLSLVHVEQLQSAGDIWLFLFNTQLNVCLKFVIVRPTSSPTAPSF